MAVPATLKRGPVLGLARVLAVNEFRARWRGLVLLGLIAALWGASTLAAVAGARRTASVVDRFQRVTVASDATFSVGSELAVASLVSALRARPEVSTADLLWNSSTGLAFESGLWVNVVASRDGAWAGEFDRPVVLHGRLPQWERADEVMITEGTAKLLGVEVGEHISIPTWDADEFDAWLEVRGKYPAFNGPVIDVAVVGIGRLALSLESTDDDDLYILATPSFYDRWVPFIATNGESAVVRFSDRNVNAAELAASLSVAHGTVVNVETANQAYSGHLREAAKALQLALLVLGGAVGLVGALVVTFGVGREVRIAADKYLPLRALGATPMQRVGVLVTPVMLVAAVAAGLAMLGSWLASQLFPIGPARAAETAEGLWFDSPVMFGVVGLIAVIGAVACGAAVGPFRTEQVSVASWLRSWTRGLGAAALIGHRNAIGSRQARGGIIVAAATIAGLTASSWFAQGLDELGRETSRWGYTWSSQPELNFEISEADAKFAALKTNPDLERLGYLDSTVALVAGTPVSVSTFAPLAGELFTPRLLAGRLPLAMGEIALGERTAHSLGLEVGDTVVLDSTFAPSSLAEVVGIVVPPARGPDTEPGVGAFTSVFTFAQLSVPAASIVRLLIIEYQRGSNQNAIEAALTAEGWRFEARSHPRTPKAISNTTGVVEVVRWLFAFFLILGTLSTLLIAARQGKRNSRDLLVMRTLGFTPRDGRRCLLIEASTMSVIGLAIGTTAGVVVGYQTWRLTTGDLGVVDTMPSVALVAVAVCGLTLIGTAVAAWVANRVVVGRGSSYQRQPR